jgi:hypothetical protein
MNKDKFQKDEYVINEYLKNNSKIEAPYYYFQSTEQHNHIVILYITEYNTTCHFPLDFFHQ